MHAWSYHIKYMRPLIDASPLINRITYIALVGTVHLAPCLFNIPVCVTVYSYVLHIPSLSFSTFVVFTRHQFGTYVWLYSLTVVEATMVIYVFFFLIIWISYKLPVLSMQHLMWRNPIEGKSRSWGSVGQETELRWVIKWSRKETVPGSAFVVLELRKA